MDSVGSLFLDLNINPKNLNKQISKASNDASKIANSAFSKVGKIVAAGLSSAAIVSFGKSCLNLGSDLQEVQNVVDVTFPSMNAQVNEFARNAINQFGLSETVAKRMTGTYGAMAKAFGFSESAAYDMATSLTGLAGDVASFYNLDPTEAYTKLKSVFSGETETLKDLGIVMTQNALDQYALANGYGRTTNAMSEQEKVSLRLAFVTDQLSAASGDFIRASDSWANKVRVLNLNFQSLKATLGQGFITLLSPLISLLNSVILKLQEAAKWFTTFVSLLSSNKKTSNTLGSVSKSIGKMSEGTSDLAKNVSSVGGAAKKAAKEMGALAGFDEINNLTTSAADAGGLASGGASLSGLDMSGVNNAIDIDTSQAEENIDHLKSKIDSFTKFFKKNAKVITSISAGIGAGLVAFEVVKNWGKITGGLTAMMGPLKWVSAAITTFAGSIAQGSGVIMAFQTVFGTVAGTASLVAIGIGTVTAALVYLYQTSESFRNLVNEAVMMIRSILNNLWITVLQPLFSFLIDVFNTIIVPITTFLSKVVVKAVEAVATVLLSIWNNILAPIANFLVDVLGIALQGVISIWEAWKPSIESIFESLNWIWNEMLSPIVDFIVGTFCEGFEKWGNLINTLIPDVKSMFQGLTDFFVGIFTGDMEKAWSGIQFIFEGFDNFLNNVFAFDFTTVLGSLGVPLNALMNVIKSVWDTIKGIFNGIITFVSGGFTDDWGRAWQGVKDVFSSIVSGFANIFKTPINFIIDGINTFLRGLNKIKIPDWVPLVGGKGFNLPTIPRLAEGGYVKANTPQLAMIGDNRTQGEIVSPEGKMFEIMMNALKTYGMQNSTREDIQVLLSVMYEILEAIRNLRLIVDGDSLSDDNKKRDAERALRTGQLVIG